MHCGWCGRCSEAGDGLLDNRLGHPLSLPTTRYVWRSQNYRRIVGHAVHPYTSQHSHLINVIREVVDRWNHKENQLQQRRDDDYRFEHGYRGTYRTNSAITRVCAWVFPFENRV